MNPRSKYKTRQRESLMEFLRTVPGVHITAGDVCEYFRKRGTPIGQSTVYRQLESLVDEGVVNKYVIDGGSPACFEYISEDAHGGAEGSFHCKCEKCGKLIHMRCEELDEVGARLYGRYGFKVDPARTVFHGVCKECL